MHGLASRPRGAPDLVGNIWDYLSPFFQGSYNTTSCFETTGDTTCCFKALSIVTSSVRAQELCESRGGRRGLPVPNNSYGLCGRKATFEEDVYHSELRSCVEIEMAVLSSSVPNNPYGLCGRKATLDLNHHNSEFRSYVKVEVDVPGSSVNIYSSWSPWT